MDVQQFLNDEKRLEERRKQVIESLLAKRKNIDSELASVGYKPEGSKKRGRPKKDEKKDAA